MKKLFTLIAICASITIQAQEFKIAQSTGKVIINDLDEVTITGYDGSEVIILGDRKDNEENERAAGLRIVNSSGLKDNTGIGVSAVQEDGNVVISGIGNNCSCDGIEIKVPASMGLEYYHKTYNGDDVKISNMSGEIVISAMYNDIHLKDVTGPMSIKTVYGSIDALFSTISQTGSISLNSVYDHVDVTLPSSSTANVSLSTPYGNIYSDIDIEVSNDGGMRQISSNKLKGTINGGGVDMTLKASYDNIYLRKN